MKEGTPLQWKEGNLLVCLLLHQEATSYLSILTLRFLILTLYSLRLSLSSQANIEEKHGKHAATTFGSEGLDSKRTEGKQSSGDNEGLLGDRGNVSQLFWLLTSSTTAPRHTSSEASTIVSPSLSTEAQEDWTPQEIGMDDSDTSSRSSTINGPSSPDPIRTSARGTLSRGNIFALPFLNNPRAFTADSIGRQQVPRTQEESTLSVDVASAQDSKENGTFQDEAVATLPHTTTVATPITSISEKAGKKF